MCERPSEQDGITFSCRTCDACIAVRRAEWVARGVMERTLHKFCLSIALTYSDETQFTRDGASMFRYPDVREWLDRLRKALILIDPSTRIKFLCAGEQGDRRARVHWHVIVYSNTDPVLVGEKQRMLSGFRQVCNDRSLLMTLPKPAPEVRVNWSLWPHGYVTFQDADEGAISYALSYSLKDQFSGEKSRGTGRFEKSENFATGMFRMSKKPPIGERYVWNLFESWWQRGFVPSSLNFKVPGLSGFYHPSGRFRKLILSSLYSLNKRILWTTGANAPQWSTLVGSINPDFVPDLELLTNGPSSSQHVEQWGYIDPDNVTSFEASLNLRSREVAERSDIYSFQRECGGSIPCRSCLWQATFEQLQSYGIEEFLYEGRSLRFRHIGTGESDRATRKFLGRLHPACRKRQTPLAKQAFPSSSGSSGCC